MEALLRFIRVRAFRRGLSGHHTAWLVVGAAVWMVGRARSHDDVVYRTELKPGERIVVTSSPPGTARSTGR